MIHKTTRISTPEGIVEGIEKMMSDNPRRRVFHAVAQPGGDTVISGPESDLFPEPGTDGGNYEGVSGVQRYAWKNVPGYAERTARYLYGILTGRRVPLN